MTVQSAFSSNDRTIRFRVFNCVALGVCALWLSACNTTGEGGAMQSALVPTVSGDAKAEGAAATENAADATSADPAAVDLAAVDPALEGATALAMLPDPALPKIGPVPGSRDEPDSAIAMAFASSAQSPASLSNGMVFATPENAPDNLDGLIQKYASTYEVPERLVRRVVHRESKFNPAARNGPYWGLMQISHPTARGMGYAGAAKGLLDAETNLKYAVKYLAGAYLVADGNENQAVRYYARGYYYDAKRKGLLHETGLRGGGGRIKAKPAVIEAAAQ